MINLVKKALQSLFPNDNDWRDKFTGAPLEKYIDGLSGQFNRDLEMVNKLHYALDPAKTAFVDELDAEFFNATGDLTEPERRGRLDARFQLMAETKLRLKIMQDVLAASGFPDVVIRTLGWNGVPETPADFFTASGFAYYGDENAELGVVEVEYGATGGVGTYLITNGGSVKYVESGPDAITKLESDPWYFGAYYVVEATGGAQLQIPSRLYETFFDLLFKVKPGSMHGILKADFI